MASAAASSSAVAHPATLEIRAPAWGAGAVTCLRSRRASNAKWISNARDQIMPAAIGMLPRVARLAPAVSVETTGAATATTTEGTAQRAAWSRVRSRALPSGVTMRSSTDPPSATISGLISTPSATWVRPGRAASALVAAPSQTLRTMRVM